MRNRAYREQVAQLADRLVAQNGGRVICGPPRAAFLAGVSRAELRRAWTTRSLVVMRPARKGGKPTGGRDPVVISLLRLAEWLVAKEQR